MIHNVLSRQLPVDAGRVEAALADRRHRPRSPAPDPRGGGVAGPARGARPDRPRWPWPAGCRSRPPTRTTSRTRRRPATPLRPRRVVTDPLRRLTPVVRLAPAKLNLTLAVTGRRDDGYHSLHSVFVPLGLADRLSLATGRRAQRHAPRRGSRRRPAGGQPRLPRAGRGPVGGRWRLAGRAGPGTGHRRPAREADPGRGRAGRRLVRRRRHGRRGARGVGRRARRADPARGGRPPRLGRAVLPRRRPGPRRGPRRARRAAPRPARVAGRRPRHAGHRRLHPGRVRRLRRDPPPRATGRSGCRPPTWPRSCAPA